LSGRIGFVCSLLGSGQISKRSLLFLGEVLGILLGLVGHLRLSGLHCLNGLQSASCGGYIRCKLWQFCYLLWIKPLFYKPQTKRNNKTNLRGPLQLVLQQKEPGLVEWPEPG
jgi:hypothetical protein